MKAAVCYGNGVVKYEEIPTPVPSEQEVRVKIKACGICGSDIPRALHTSAHYYPIVLGHECAGVVDAVGSAVKGVRVGDRVCVIPLIPCHHCERCQAGNYALCQAYRFVGSSRQGGMAEQVVVPADNVYKLPEEISFEQGALFEPATVALHAFYQNNYQPGGTVAIVGGGTVGVFALQWAQILGCKKVVVIGRDKEHLKLSKKLGADAVVSTQEPAFKQHLLNITDGQGFDYVFETAGSTDTLKHTFELAAPKARVCLVGTPSQALTFSLAEWIQLNRKEFYLTGSWMSYAAPFPGSAWKMTEECFVKGKLKFDEEMFFRKIPLSKASSAFELFAAKKVKIRGRILLVV